jgi:hypothetical protein
MIDTRFSIECLLFGILEIKFCNKLCITVACMLKTFVQNEQKANEVMTNEATVLALIVTRFEIVGRQNSYNFYLQDFMIWK